MTSRDVEPENPTLSLTARARLQIYVASAFGSIVVSYLSAKGWAGDAELAAWAGVVALVNGLAAVNVRGPARR